MTQTLPDPAVVVLVGPSGSGKSAWAAARYRAQEVVSSDQLRGIVGSGENDLDASADAFAVLDQIVAARVRRGLTTVIDTLGLDPARRRGYLDLARRAACLPRSCWSMPIQPRSGGATRTGAGRCPLPRTRRSYAGCGRPRRRYQRKAGM